MKKDQVKAGKTIQQQTGRTFHLATRLLPKRIRHATYVLYGFFRIADEIVDDPDGPDPDEQAEQLADLRAEALGEQPTDEPVLAAFVDLCEEHDIDDEWVVEFLDAMESDIDTDRYETYEDLEEYMRGSAAAVGVMMTDIMDLDDDEYEQALPHAIKLGEAFQLTNFIRDVREDVVDRDRVYLPIETLERHGVDRDQVIRLETSEEFCAAAEEELHRTEELYREGVAGIRFLPEDCQFAVLLAAVLYAEHHREIRAVDFDTITHEPDLSTARKLLLVAKTRWHWLWNKDPEAVFHRVSAVPAGEATHHEHGRGWMRWLPTR
ncbi:phytoene/squalene synthase family protein [Haloarchaeobius iranensis]|uniref:Phytoene synthase n=1 Tax=Haloarchaeobius iranensis TaxID=996166 RepID=A0A1G9WWY4_9EURY|nr:phytoene/squalene synthase family protein [Haloarchaeobius iranensis]SDM88633.1 phytoene synthase [Haloarchaeobius iranensis]